MTFFELWRYSSYRDWNWRESVRLHHLLFLGFKGNARVIMPGLTACIECNLDLFPQQVSNPFHFKASKDFLLFLFVKPRLV